MKGSGETKLLLILGLIVLLGGGAMFFLQQAQDKAPVGAPTPKPFAWDQPTFDRLIKDAPHVHDSPGAEITVVEFADVQCPSCRRAFDSVLHKMKKDKPVRFIFRHLPLVEMHERAMPSALAVEAADKQGKFWEMYDALFDGIKTELTDAYIEKCATKIGLDIAKFKKDLNDPTSKARIESDMKAATEFHVSSTPTFIVRNAKGEFSQGVGGKELQEILAKNGIKL